MTDDIRVLLVDDQELVRAGFRIILESEPGIVIVGEARTGSEAIARATELCPDVICMDVQMPGMDGLAATREIVKDPRLCSSVLILTTFDRDDYLFDALSAGASGFLLKNASPEDLVDAVQVVARGDAMLAPDVTRRVIERFAADPARSPREHPGVAELTDREREVLVYLARGWSNAEIAAQLFVGEATVKTHVSKILMKLRVRDRIQAVVFAYEHGIAVPGRS
ncbi:response regulator transcription factor [Rathayibacter sp. SD072]|uniref:response regulator n=1 Tax=Rathayibacter sp. SD072 TaxID=2781731 RepID=UPI001A97CD67|nr:response regulator transcription factor [Rathayibacter sp. SD072]MBO0983293.1 response regulator transcription factor [Rathayibacter sp. SD072]